MRERDRGHTYIFFEKAWASYIYIISNGVKRAEFSHVNKDLKKGIDQPINQSPSEGSGRWMYLLNITSRDPVTDGPRMGSSPKYIHIPRCVSIFVSENYRKIP